MTTGDEDAAHLAIEDLGLTESPARAEPSPTDPVYLRPHHGSPEQAAAGAAPGAQSAGAAGVQGAVGTVSPQAPVALAQAEQAASAGGQPQSSGKRRRQDEAAPQAAAAAGAEQLQMQAPAGVAQSASWQAEDGRFSSELAAGVQHYNDAVYEAERAPKKKRHHHDPPEEMTAEKAEECLRDFRSWVHKAQKYEPDGPKRCCARVHQKCKKADGKKAGGSKTATFRPGVRDGWKLCHWCYACASKSIVDGSSISLFPFLKTLNFAKKALELHGDLAPRYADLIAHLR
jgi:hypothetical protein